jgi:hypothetical protein
MSSVWQINASLEVLIPLHEDSKTQCHLCYKVLNRLYALRMHLVKVHEISAKFHPKW